MRDSWKNFFSSAKFFALPVFHSLFHHYHRSTCKRSSKLGITLRPSSQTSTSSANDCHASCTNCSVQTAGASFFGFCYFLPVFGLLFLYLRFVTWSCQCRSCASHFKRLRSSSFFTVHVFSYMEFDCLWSHVAHKVNRPNSKICLVHHSIKHLIFFTLFNIHMTPCLIWHALKNKGSCV